MNEAKKLTTDEQLAVKLDNAYYDVWAPIENRIVRLKWDEANMRGREAALRFLAKARELLAVAPAPPVEGVEELAALLMPFLKEARRAMYSSKHPEFYKNARNAATAAIQALGVDKVRARLDERDGRIIELRNQARSQAAEMSTLRAELEQRKSEYGRLVDQIGKERDELRADVERLRAEKDASDAALAVALSDQQPAGTGMPAVGCPVETSDANGWTRHKVDGHTDYSDDLGNHRKPGFTVEGRAGIFGLSEEGKNWRRPPLETAAPKEPAEKCRSCPHLEHDAGQCTGYMQYTDTPSVKCMCLAAKAAPPATAPAEKCGVRRAIERAVEFYGGEDGSRQEGVFNLACLSQALMEQAGLRGAVDGRLCRVILAGRDDVEQFGPSDCYYRLRTSPAPESTKAPEQPAHAAPYPPGKPWERELWVVVVNGDLWLDIGGDPKLYPIRADAEKVAANIGGTVREARPGERAALGEPKEQRPRIDGILSEVETTILTAMRAKAKAEQPAAPAVAMPRLEAWANEMQLMGKINEGHVFFMMGHARADLSAIETKWAGVVEAHLGRIADLETRLKKDAICLAERARQLDEKSQEIWRLNDEVTTLRRAERSTIAERQRAREEKTRIAELEAKLAELQRDYQIARDGWNEAEKKLAAGQGEPLTDREIQDLVYGWKADVRRGDADLLNFAERVAEAQRKKGMAQTANERIYLEGTPVGTKICYLYGGKVRIMGRPAAGSDHNCDEMGCGSAQEHVFQIIDVEQTDANAQAARELAELRAAYRPKDRSRVAAIYVDADKKIEVERLLFGLAGEKAEDGE